MMRRVLSYCAAAALVGACVLYAQNPDEWPILNNINHTGFSPTTVLKPPLKLKWSAKTPGAFKAGPVVAEGKVVVQSRDGYLFCFDAHTGQLLWRHFVKRVTAHYVGCLETGPCIWIGRAYAAFYSDGHANVTGMRCFDLGTGRLLWKKNTGFTSHRIHYSPQVSNGKLFFCSNREVTGLNTENRSLLRYKAQVQAWDALTGDTLWTYTMWDSACNNTTLVVAGDTVFASVGVYNTSTLGKTVALDLNGNLLWSSTQYHVSGKCGNLQYIPGKLIMLRGEGESSTRGVTILNTADWSVALDSGGGDFYGKIVTIMNGKYYSRSYGSWPEPYSLATGQALPFTTSPGWFANSGCGAPSAANGYIYTGFGNTLDRSILYGDPAAVGPGHSITAQDETGALKWSFRDCSNHCASVAIAYGRLYASSGAEGMVYCFENAP